MTTVRSWAQRCGRQPRLNCGLVVGDTGFELLSTGIAAVSLATLALA